MSRKAVAELARMKGKTVVHRHLLLQNAPYNSFLCHQRRERKGVCWDMLQPVVDCTNCIRHTVVCRMLRTIVLQACDRNSG